MSLAQSVQSLYGNIFSALMWAALSDQVKRQLINDPASSAQMNAEPKAIKQEAESQNRPLTQEQMDTILNAPPCPFNLAAMKEKFLANYPNGARKLAELQRKAIQETDRYLSRELTPMLNQNTLFEVLEHPEIRYPGEVPAPEAQPEPLPRFDSSERSQRRNASAAVRRSMIQFTAWYADFLPGRADIPRIYKSLYMPEYAITPAQNHNDEIDWIFNPQGEKYQQEKAALAGTLGSPEAAEGQLARRRGQLVMERLRDFRDLCDHLDTLTDPSLPGAELGKNYLRIERAANIVPDMRHYLAAAEQGFLQVSDEDKRLMESLNLPSVGSAVTSAKSKLQLMANPLYEQFDLNALSSRNISGIKAAYFLNDGADDTLWREGKIARNPKFRQYANQVQDTFSTFLMDAEDHVGQHKLAMNTMRKELISGFGFQSQIATVYYENYEGGIKPQDQPFAYEQGNRVIVIQQKTPTDTLSIQHPEALFNYSLRGTNANHLQSLLDKDPWYMLNSGQFRDLKSALRDIGKMSPLKADYTPQEFARAKRRFETLKAASEAYTAHKERDLRRKGRLDQREKDRLAANKKILSYAKTKLKELELVNNARVTLAAHAGKSLLQIKADTAVENNSPEMKSYLLQKDAAERSANPGAWLQSMYNDNAKLPYGLSRLLTVNVASLKLDYARKDWLQPKVADQNMALTKKTAGCVIAAELILQERRAVRSGAERNVDAKGRGPLEAFLSNNQAANDSALVLGEVALNRYREQNPQLPRDSNRQVLSNHLINGFLGTFDPREMAAQFRPNLQSLMVKDAMKKKYVDSIRSTGKNDAYLQPFQSFAENAIVGPASRCVASAKNVTQQDLDKLLSSALAYEMLQSDRRNPPANPADSMEPLLGSPQQLGLLRAWAEQSGVYRTLRAACLDRNGQLSPQRVMERLQEGLPEAAVQRCKNSYKEGFAQWREQELVRRQQEREVKRPELRQRSEQLPDQIARKNAPNLSKPDLPKPNREASLPKGPRLP